MATLEQDRYEDREAYLKRLNVLAQRKITSIEEIEIESIGRHPGTWLRATPKQMVVFERLIVRGMLEWKLDDGLLPNVGLYLTDKGKEEAIIIRTRWGLT